MNEALADPLGLIPLALPAHPRVFVTRAHIESTRESAGRCAWRRAALALLRERCRRAPSFHDDPQAPLTPDTKGAYNAMLFYTTRNAMAFNVTRESQYHREAVRSFRQLSASYARRPLTGHDCRAVGGGMYEAAFIAWFGCAYDLLAAEGFSDADQRVLDEALDACVEVIEANPHRTCSNHNTWGFRAALSVAGAKGDRRGIHAVLYGSGEGKQRRYGFIHQLRHDLLADGIEWEHNLRHHFLTLEVYADLADRCRNLGIDIWHRTFASAEENEGADRHRDYGPSGQKSLKSAFDAPLYQLFPSGEFPLFGDSRVTHLRALAGWGIFYALAYEAYADPRHAWVINRLEELCGPKVQPELPAILQTAAADLDFVRLHRDVWPRGHFSLSDDARIGLTGQHRGGCTLLPTNGSALLRSAPTEPAAPAAFLFWGPHSAGHQGPAALNLELYAGGRRLTDAPWSGSFDDPLHLNWCRTTIAHNTVTVDEVSMYPYDQPTESIWESDEYHGKISDGKLLWFCPDIEFKSVRAFNDRVYSGVRLDRTVVVGREFVLDLFRCLSDQEHLYDWAMHCPAEFRTPDDLPPADLGVARGYRYLRDARRWQPSGKRPAGAFTWAFPAGDWKAQVWDAASAQVILARNPVPGPENGFPGSDHHPEMACSTLLVRRHARSAAFVTLFTFAATGQLRPQLASVKGEAAGDILITINPPGRQELNFLVPVNGTGPTLS